MACPTRRERLNEFHGTPQIGQGFVSAPRFLHFKSDFKLTNIGVVREERCALFDLAARGYRLVGNLEIKANF